MAELRNIVPVSYQVPHGWQLPSDRDSSGRSLGEGELELLGEVIRSGTLTSTNGTQTDAFEREFAALIGVDHAIACSSGTAAIHAAIASIDLEPGDEVVTTSVTDMGALTPILYQGAIPVFADIDPESLLVTADTIRDRLSDRTRAIIVTHLFGKPCDMSAIMQLATAQGIPVIEDCAQAYLAEWDGRFVGRFGVLACFSLQQGKHVTAGEGGIVVTDDSSLARRARLFVNKAWPYGESAPDHEFLALNYRITELQAAVARTQVARLPEFVERRVTTADRLTKQLACESYLGLPGSQSPAVHTYWRYCLRIDESEIPGGPDALAIRLRTHGVAAGARYIQKPAFACRVIAEQRTFGSSRFPFTLARPEALDYSPDRFPGTLKGLRQALVLPWNERISESDVDVLAALLTTEAAALRSEAR